MRSLKKHSEDLEAIVHSLESHPCILGLTETWLGGNDNCLLILIKAYIRFLLKIRKANGEAVMLQIRDYCNIIKEIFSPFDEPLFVESERKGFRFLIGVVYNPPCYNKLDFIEKMDELGYEHQSIRHQRHVK